MYNWPSNENDKLPVYTSPHSPKKKQTGTIRDLYFKIPEVRNSSSPPTYARGHGLHRDPVPRCSSGVLDVVTWSTTQFGLDCEAAFSIYITLLHDFAPYLSTAVHPPSAPVEVGVQHHEIRKCQRKAYSKLSCSLVGGVHRQFSAIFRFRFLIRHRMRSIHFREFFYFIFQWPY